MFPLRICIAPSFSPKSPINDRISAETVDLLLKYQADPLLQDNVGKTALHHLATQDGSDNKTGFQRIIHEELTLDIEDNYGLTPLCCALSFGLIENAQSLIEKGADIHFVNAAGHNILQAICNSPIRNFNHASKGFEFLKENNFDMKVVDEQGNSLLHLLARHTDKYNSGNIHAIKHLIGVGLDKDARNKSGKRPYDLMLSKTKFAEKILK